VKLADAESTARGEAQMISAVLAGDTEQYYALIGPYERTVYRMALSFVKNESEAEDVAHESFLRALRNLASFRGGQIQYLVDQHHVERGATPAAAAEYPSHGIARSTTSTKMGPASPRPF